MGMLDGASDWSNKRKAMDVAGQSNDDSANSHVGQRTRNAEQQGPPLFFDLAGARSDHELKPPCRNKLQKLEGEMAMACFEAAKSEFECQFASSDSRQQGTGCQRC